MPRYAASGVGQHKLDELPQPAEVASGVGREFVQVEFAPAVSERAERLSIQGSRRLASAEVSFEDWSGRAIERHQDGARRLISGKPTPRIVHLLPLLPQPVGAVTHRTSLATLVMGPNSCGRVWPSSKLAHPLTPRR